MARLQNDPASQLLLCEALQDLVVVVVVPSDHNASMESAGGAGGAGMARKGGRGASWAWKAGLLADAALGVDRAPTMPLPELQPGAAGKLSKARRRDQAAGRVRGQARRVLQLCRSSMRRLRAVAKADARRRP